MSPRVNTEDLIDAGEVAHILGFKHRNAVSLYQRRYEDMPRPVVVRSSGRTMLWLRPEIIKWGKKTGRIRMRPNR
jgi:predicted DNA-binding transcriptional regulator AlpA